MSATPDDQSDRRHVSKVSFSRISSELLVVKIKKMNEEVKEEDIPKTTRTFKPIRRSRSNSDRNGRKNNSKSTMTDEQKTASSFSQTISEEQTVSQPKTDNLPDYTPCIKHAAQNLSRKASDIPSDKINLCNNCSKSMLSYIFLVQDFLDGLAKEIRGNEESECLQCARQEVRDNVANLEDTSFRERSETSRTHSEIESNFRTSESKRDYDQQPKRPPSRKSHRQESKNDDDHQHRSVNPSLQGSAKRQDPQVEFLHKISSSSVRQEDRKDNVPITSGEKRLIQDQTNTQQSVPTQQQALSYQQNNQQQALSYQQNNQQQALPYQQNNQQQTLSDQQNNQQLAFDSQTKSEQVREIAKHKDEYFGHSSASHSDKNSTTVSQSNEQLVDQTAFRSPMQRTQPNYDYIGVNPGFQEQNDRNNNVVQHSPTLFKDNVDGIVSTLSNAEREIYDSARNGAGWESLTGPQERLGTSAENVIATEAFVTYCRNNAEAIGCLVVGTSLLLCRTSRTLCVLVADGVSTAFRDALSSVFQVVQFVRSLDSLGTTKLALLEQPELGITFDKLNIWRLGQFTKCIYLNPDTLVIQNCDELFSREELSAVPDIGWPDCFNSGVFVFSPSIKTFWDLLEFSEKQGSYDGGDQGLLNSYFISWSSDISKKLSFIYNLMANVSYTYTPAFRQFGRNVKIVQFHGSFKPWHVKFFPNSGQVSPSSPVHPTYIQFVTIWLNIFRISVLRLMSQEIKSYAASQETICAVEILRFFPLPSESESDFFLTPPSVRLRLAERKLLKSTSLPLSEARRRKSAEFFRYTSTEEENIPEVDTPRKIEAKKDAEPIDVLVSDAGTSDSQAEAKPQENEPDLDEVFKKLEVVEKEVRDENTLPGAEVGNYLGMKAWEQGRMDYQGADSSDNVIKRLQFLMSRSKDE